MYLHHDPDEWEVVSESHPCTACHGDHSRCNGACNGMASWGLVRRSPEKIAEIKAEKRKQHEGAVIAEAERILGRKLRP